MLGGGGLGRDGCVDGLGLGDADLARRRPGDGLTPAAGGPVTALRVASGCAQPPDCLPQAAEAAASGLPLAAG